MRKDGRTLLVLKQDGQGVNYQFTFSVQDGTYKPENVEQKQGERIDGKDFLTAELPVLNLYSCIQIPPAGKRWGYLRYTEKYPSLQNCSFS